MTPSPPRFILPLSLLTAILATSTASILIRFAQQDAPSLAIAALRLTFASLVLAPLAWLRHRDELRALTRADLMLALLSGLFLAAHFATWISSLEYTSVASSVVFVSTGPLWVALVSPLLLREQLARAALIGIGLALLGGAVIGLSDACAWRDTLICPALSDALRGKAMWGNFLALAGAWMVSGYLVIGRKLRAKISLIPYVFLVYGMGALTLLAVAAISGQILTGYRPGTYGWILLMALVPQLIGHSTYNWALRYLPASMVATANLGEPIGSALLAFLILGETLTAIKLGGAALILAGIYLSSRNQGASHPASQEQINEA
jgi:drug/metabolite transporter (DMT)-like permease